ncbi:MAG: glycosyltransferase [Candidatus Aenigmarchaeota archaeon]|nr:glycosyltransferase [Candidatus Aenigmarchaeota archaeon]
MKICQISPPFIPVSSSIVYGGVERVVYRLDKTLTELGHETSVIAPKGSKTIGRLYESINQTIHSPTGYCVDMYSVDLPSLYLRFEHMSEAVRIANENDFDIIHCHDENMLSHLQLIEKPSLYTIHSPPEELWQVDTHPKLFSQNLNISVVSKKIRDLFNETGYDIKYVVPNGIDVTEDYFSKEKAGYIFSLSIIAPRKGQHIAIDVAKYLGKDLIIGGNIGDESYWENKVKPHITDSIENKQDKLNSYLQLPKNSTKIVYAGALDDSQKFPLYKYAQAFLMPSCFEDPMPLVVIEAMGCGTPVVAFRRGGIPEMVTHGTSGYLVDTEEEMIDAVKEINKINPAVCREYCMKNFSARKMAEDYLAVYRDIIESSK